VRPSADASSYPGPAFAGAQRGVAVDPDDFRPDTYPRVIDGTHDPGERPESTAGVRGRGCCQGEQNNDEGDPEPHGARITDRQTGHKRTEPLAELDPAWFRLGDAG
jgi:hypothetical protein